MSYFFHSLSEEERKILRIVVKQVHLKYHPEQFQTDYEADKMIAIIAPETIEKLIKVGKYSKIDQM